MNNTSTLVPYVLGYLSRIQNGQRQVLLLYRSNTGFGNGSYSLPGGKVDKNESPHQALVRELYEELALEIDPKDCYFSTLLYFQGETQTCVAFLFTCKQWSGEPLNNEPHKHAHLKWFNLSALPPTLLPRHALLLAHLDKGIIYGETGF